MNWEKGFDMDPEGKKGPEEKSDPDQKIPEKRGDEVFITQGDEISTGSEIEELALEKGRKITPQKDKLN